MLRECSGVPVAVRLTGGWACQCLVRPSERPLIAPKGAWVGGWIAPSCAACLTPVRHRVRIPAAQLDTASIVKDTFHMVSLLVTGTLGQFGCRL